MTRPGQQGRVARIALAAPLGVVMVIGWSMMMREAARAMYFEPTSEAVARADAATPRSVAYAAIVIGAVAALVLITRSSRLLWLATPAVTTAALLIAAPQAAAFLFGLGATAIGLLITTALSIRHYLTRAERRRS